MRGGVTHQVLSWNKRFPRRGITGSGRQANKKAKRNKRFELVGEVLFGMPEGSLYPFILVTRGGIWNQRVTSSESLANQNHPGQGVEAPKGNDAKSGNGRRFRRILFAIRSPKLLVHGTD